MGKQSVFERNAVLRKIKKAFSFFKDWDQTKKNIGWMAAQGKPYTKYILLLLLVNIVSLLLSFASTIIGKYVVDAATKHGEIIEYALIMGGVTIITIGFSMGSQLISAFVSERFTFGLRARIYDEIQRGVWQKVSKFHSGDLLTRLTSDISSISGGIISIVPSIITLVLQLILAFGILYYYDPFLAVFALALGPVGAIAMLVFREKYQKYQKALRENESEYRSFMQENLSHLTVVKAFGLEDEANRSIDDMRQKRIKTVMASTRMSMWMNALMRLTFRAGYVVAFCWGAYRIYTQDISYGTMTVFISLVSQVQSPLSNLAHVLPQFFGMLIASERIREVSEIEREETPAVEGMPSSVGLIMENVSFSYENEPVLRNINVKVNAGDRVGIIGLSGAGKTTFIRLALALVKCSGEGRCMYVDEQGNTEDASSASRRFISYVPQGNTLMSGTIEHNLRCGDRNASPEKLLRALDDSDALEFIQKLPEGMETVVSENAGGLSEGQAQRIAIARALLRDKPLLILDEATSALDEATEARVLERITQRRDRTCLIITHRSSMLKYCNKVLEIGADGFANMTEREN